MEVGSGFRYLQERMIKIMKFKLLQIIKLQTWFDEAPVQCYALTCESPIEVKAHMLSLLENGFGTNENVH